GEWVWRTLSHFEDRSPSNAEHLDGRPVVSSGNVQGEVRQRLGDLARRHARTEGTPDHPFGVDSARMDDDDGDVGLAQLLGEGLGEARERPLRSIVDALKSRADGPADAADVNDAPSPVPQHRR